MAKQIGSYTLAADFNNSDWQEEEDEAIEGIANHYRGLAKVAGKEFDLIGETIRFQIADGYAVYMIANFACNLIHIGVSDCYEIPAAHLRGLRKPEIVSMAKQARLFKEMFSKQGAA